MEMKRIREALPPDSYYISFDCSNSRIVQRCYIEDVDDVLLGKPSARVEDEPAATTSLFNLIYNNDANGSISLYSNRTKKILCVCNHIEEDPTFKYYQNVTTEFNLEDCSNNSCGCAKFEVRIDEVAYLSVGRKIVVLTLQDVDNWKFMRIESFVEKSAVADLQWKIHRGAILFYFEPVNRLN